MSGGGTNHGEESIDAGLRIDCSSRTHLPVSAVPKSLVGGDTFVGRGSGVLCKWTRVENVLC
jgi:hypothetical protein